MKNETPISTSNQPKRKPPAPEEIADNMYVVDEYFEEETREKATRLLLSRIDKTYFRSKLVGFDEYPENPNPNAPLIFAGNHSGMAFPWDAIVFLSALLDYHNYDSLKAPRPLTAPMLSATPVMCPFVYPNFWKVGGGIDATFINFCSMMQQTKHDVLIFPEGVPGIGKGWNRRYQLQRFSSSFIRMSIRYKADIIPYATVNGEYINPFSWNSNKVNKIVNKVGIPFLPVAFQTILIFIQPWAFYYALPAKLVFVKGKRVKPYLMTDKKWDEINDEEYRKIADIVRKQMQLELDEAVEKYGKSPYKMGDFLKTVVKDWRFFPYNFPFGWPLLFAEYERLAKKGKEEKIYLGFFSTILIIIRNPFVLAFYLPIIGWVFLIIKAFSQHRKTTKEAAKRKKEREAKKEQAKSANLNQ